MVEEAVNLKSLSIAVQSTKDSISNAFLYHDFPYLFFMPFWPAVLQDHRLLKLSTWLFGDRDMGFMVQMMHCLDLVV